MYFNNFAFPVILHFQFLRIWSNYSLEILAKSLVTYYYRCDKVKKKKSCN